ncbi:MAG: protein kinase [Acidobacteria bacterium]|nr:protein kinase [Acidobacteriota bacterium]
MTRDEYARLKQIVAGALSQPEPGRSAYLTAQCGSDSTTRSEVESLLAAADRAAALYEDPTLLVEGIRITIEALEDVDSLALPLLAPLRTGFPDTTRDDDFAGTERYTVRRRVGAGGMGVVYEVDDRVRGQIVALKTLKHRSGHDIYQLKREFRQLADVAHPNLVSLYDLVVNEGHCFFTMEFVDGVTFVEYARQNESGPDVFDRVRRLFPQLVHGIHELHRRGMQHRDIKPSNVLVTRAGRVVILDFGLTSGAVLEMPGYERAGTPAYLSPEQCNAGPVSSASDWYSVGATLYHALSGRLPFEGAVRDVIEMKMTKDPRSVADVATDVPRDLAHVCMAMLQREPAARMPGGSALEWLSGGAPRGPSIPPEHLGEVFVGRQTALAVLSAALKNVRAQRSASVFIHGPSGIGKSALVQHFIETRLEGPSVLVLRSRCHEHESIPYKALDGIIDSLARHLSMLPAIHLAQVLPRDAHALARLFPVMRTVAFESPDQADTDPHLVQRKAFTAFRDVLALLAARQPLIIDIDDFHWADADSVRWLTELLRPPGPPSLLMLVSFRSEELEAKPFLRSLIERVDIGEHVSLSLAPMSEHEVAELVEALRPGDPATARRREIARDSGGNPFLVEALTRHAALGAHTGDRATLDEMLARRLEAMPDQARSFLETLAVCGRPILPARVFEACGFHGDERPVVALLKAAHLVRNSRTADRVEMYHDRIRDTLATRISEDAARRIHEVLAHVLVAHEDDDPEALFEHYRGAGRTDLAASQAVAAAEKANGVLAFDLAAAFYRHALALQPDVEQRAHWGAGFARALENAGRPVEAADAYLAVAGQGRSVDAIEWQRKAAELFLIGGQIDQGLRVAEQVLRSAGVRVARGPRTALASLAFRRFQLQWRGVEFTPRPASRIAQDHARRIDACWSVTVGMAMVDPLRAADFNVRQLLWALALGDRDRVARALALEGGFSAIITVLGGLQRSEELHRRAEALAEGAGHHYVTALTSVWSGIAAFLTGRWKETTRLCGRAVTILRDQCTGVTWELNLAQNFFLFSLVYRGELREAAGHLPELLRSARERGNVYLELELSTRLGLIWLAADQPVEAERRANDAIALWSQRGFQRPHYHHLLTLIQTRLYEGRALEAWEQLERHAAVLAQNHFVRVQHTRVEIANFRARCALAVAALGDRAHQMRAIATDEAEKISRERMPWSDPFARLIRATVAFQEGRAADAAEGLFDASQGFVAADMQLYAAVCRMRLSTIENGSRSRAVKENAEHFMALQDVRNPAAMARLLAPGMPD